MESERGEGGRRCAGAPAAARTFLRGVVVVVVPRSGQAKAREEPAGSAACGARASEGRQPLRQCPRRRAGISCAGQSLASQPRRGSRQHGSEEASGAGRRVAAGGRLPAGLGGLLPPPGRRLSRALCLQRHHGGLSRAGAPQRPQEHPEERRKAVSAAGSREGRRRSDCGRGGRGEREALGPLGSSRHTPSHPDNGARQRQRLGMPLWDALGREGAGGTRLPPPPRAARELVGLRQPPPAGESFWGFGNNPSIAFVREPPPRAPVRMSPLPNVLLSVWESARV